MGYWNSTDGASTFWCGNNNPCLVFHVGSFLGSVGGLGGGGWGLCGLGGLGVGVGVGCGCGRRGW